MTNKITYYPFNKPPLPQVKNLYKTRSRISLVSYYYTSIAFHRFFAWVTRIRTQTQSLHDGAQIIYNKKSKWRGGLSLITSTVVMWNASQNDRSEIWHVQHTHRHYSGKTWHVQYIHILVHTDVAPACMHTHLLNLRHNFRYAVQCGSLAC